MGKTQGKSSATEWTLSMDSVDIVHGLSGHCPWTQWTLSMDLRSNTPAGQCPWTISTGSMDFLQAGLENNQKSGNFKMEIK